MTLRRGEGRESPRNDGMHVQIEGHTISHTGFNQVSTRREEKKGKVG